MKKLLLLLLLIFIGCSDSESNIIYLNTDSILKDGIYLDNKNFKPISGKVIYVSDNNIVTIEGNLTDGIPNGSWTEWYPNGIKSLEGNFSMGIENGQFTRYDMDGTIKSVIEYSNGTLDGFFSDKVSEGKYLKGKKEGIWLQKIGQEIISQIGYKNGIYNGIYKTSEYDGNYKMGLKDGIWKKYKNNVLVSEIEYKDDKFNGFYKTPLEKGQFKMGVRVGSWEFINEEESSITKGKYIDGVQDGLWETYLNSSDDSGSFKEENIISRIEYKNGIFDGLYQDKNNKGSYSKGKKNGFWIERSDDNLSYYLDLNYLSSFGNYIMGKKNGKWIYSDIDIYDHQDLITKPLIEINESLPVFKNSKVDILISITYDKNILDGPYSFNVSSLMKLKEEDRFLLKNGNYSSTEYVSIKGNFTNGLKDGVWKSFNIDNNIIKVENFSKNKLNGQTIEILYRLESPDYVDLLVVRNYSQGKKDGPEIYYQTCLDKSENKTYFYPKYVKSYKDDTLHGWSGDLKFENVICSTIPQNDRRFSIHQEDIKELYNFGQKVYSEVMVEYSLLGLSNSKKKYQVFINNDSNFKSVFLGDETFSPEILNESEWKWIYEDYYKSSKSLINQTFDLNRFEKKLSEL